MMMRYILIIPLIFINLNINAQGNLQFNKVKLIGSQIDTVPNGKVWKVESIMPVNYTGPIYIYLNNQSVYISIFNSQTAFSGYSTVGIAMADAHYTKLPFWLPEGTTLSNSIGLISIIEFNIIQ